MKNPATDTDYSRLTDKGVDHVLSWSAQYAHVNDVVNVQTWLDGVSWTLTAVHRDYTDWFLFGGWQAAAAALRASRGLIINKVEIHGRRPLKAHPVYSAAKAGLVMLPKSLARELGPEIRVNGIAPGPVLWPERDLDDALTAEIIAGTALTPGLAEDIARTAYFFAAEAQYVTGQVIAVDGGRSL